MDELKTTKKCNECLKSKPLINFHKDSSSSDGYRAKCIKCRYPHMSGARLRRKQRGTSKRELHHTLNEDSYNKLKYLADNLGVSMSMVAEAAIKQYIDRNMATSISYGIKKNNAIK
jgi:hypothetical protein